MPERNFEAYHADLLALDPDALYRFAVTGQAPFPVSADPVPNLLFTRDPAAVVGEFAILSHAATGARMPESAIVNTIYRHHPRFAAATERLISVPDDVFFEGGDLLVVSETIVMIGQSERTSLGGVMHVAQELLERTPVEHVLMVNLPKERYCMHLDTVFTFADARHVRRLPAHHRAGDATRRSTSKPATRRGASGCACCPSVRVALDELTGRTHTFIPCGGTEEVHQRREQWTDGANLFAVRPGLVVGYDRNRRTYDAMATHGFETVDAGDFLERYPDAASVPTDRTAGGPPHGPRALARPRRPPLHDDAAAQGLNGDREKRWTGTAAERTAGPRLRLPPQPSHRPTRPPSPMSLASLLDPDRRWMRLALAEAERAAEAGEVPVGAVVVWARADRRARAQPGRAARRPDGARRDARPLGRLRDARHQEPRGLHALRHAGAVPDVRRRDRPRARLAPRLRRVRREGRRGFDALPHPAGPAPQPPGRDRLGRRGGRRRQTCCGPSSAPAGPRRRGCGDGASAEPPDPAVS